MVNALRLHSQGVLFEIQVHPAPLRSITESALELCPLKVLLYNIFIVLVCLCVIASSRHLKLHLSVLAEIKLIACNHAIDA